MSRNMYPCKGCDKMLYDRNRSDDDLKVCNSCRMIFNKVYDEAERLGILPTKVND